MDLTNDEIVVLNLAVCGESLIPLGRHEYSVLSLYEKGLLSKLDNVNYVISNKGRKVITDCYSPLKSGLIEDRNGIAGI